MTEPPENSMMEIDPYFDMIFEEIKDATKCLNDDNHWKTYLFIIEHPDASLLELSGYLCFLPSDVKEIIDDLIKGGLITQTTTDLSLNLRSKCTRYNASKIGKIFIRSLAKGFMGLKI
jgi:DNA-binding MarR family transcriptional regulator